MATKRNKPDARGAPARKRTAKRDPLARVRELCLALPETSEKTAWDAPTFRVAGKLFVMFVDQLHGDGRVAIWCLAPPGAQQELVASDPLHFFVPPYVGPSGWVGIRLDRDLDWSVVEAMIKQAHRERAPRRLLDRMDAD